MITAEDITARSERFRIDEDRRLRLQVTKQEQEIQRLRSVIATEAGALEWLNENPTRPSDYNIRFAVNRLRASLRPVGE
jgi:hypothetical protein